MIVDTFYGLALFGLLYTFSIKLRIWDNFYKKSRGIEIKKTIHEMSNKFTIVVNNTWVMLIALYFYDPTKFIVAFYWHELIKLCGKYYLNYNAQDLTYLFAEFFLLVSVLYAHNLKYSILPTTVLFLYTVKEFYVYCNEEITNKLKDKNNK